MQQPSISAMPHNLFSPENSALKNLATLPRPTPRQLNRPKHSHPTQLLGLYQGVPQTRRGRRYGLVLPDKISIFQKPIEEYCRFGHEIEATIEEVVRHEIAHHFGLDDNTLRKIEKEKHRSK